MSLLVVNNLQQSFGPETIFSGVSFKLEWRQKLGLVGRNGAGKTTILRILTGQQEPEKGSVNYAARIRYGYLKQEEGVDPNRTVLQEAEAAFGHVQAMETRLREVEHDMSTATGDDLERIMDEYSLLHDRFEAMGGYDNLRDIPAVLKKLGFGPTDLHKICGKLSGGEKTRLGIARLLLSGPDILLLDEPTNHLDIEATEWLERFSQRLRRRDGAGIARPLFSGSGCHQYRGNRKRQTDRVSRQLLRLPQTKRGGAGAAGGNVRARTARNQAAGRVL